MEVSDDCITIREVAYKTPTRKIQLEQGYIELKYEVLKGDRRYIVKHPDGSIERPTIRAFWIRVSEIEIKDNGTIVGQPKITQEGPLSSRLGRVKALCDRLSKNLVRPDDVSPIIEEHIKTTLLQYYKTNDVIDSSNPRQWTPDFRRSLELVLRGGKFRNNSNIHKK